KPVVSRLLLWANLLVFGYGIYLAWPSRAVIEAFLVGPFGGARLGLQRAQQILQETGALSGEAIIAGQWWRLLSSGFVQIGLLHLFMNMYVLKALGQQAEAIW